MKIQLDVPHESYELLKSLQQTTGIQTCKELFNNAMTLLAWAADQRSKGFRICAMDRAGGLTELHMPVLDAAHRRGHGRSQLNICA